MSKFFNRAELGEYKISKKTKQKKKIEKKNSFTTGLELGFTKLYLVKSARELRHVNLQFFYTKTTRLIIEKDNKKSKKTRGGIKLGKGVKSIKVARKMQKKKKNCVRLNLILMLITNIMFPLKKNLFLSELCKLLLKLESYSDTPFYICFVLKYKIYNIIQIFRFSKYSNVCAVIYCNFFVPLFFYQKQKNFLICQADFNNIDLYFSLFASNVSSKKNVLYALALKKKANLFKKYDSYKRSLFYNMYDYIKEKHFDNAAYK